MPLYNASGAVRVRVATGTTFCGAYHPDGALWVTEAQGTSWTGRTAPDGSMYVTLAVGAVRGRYAPNGSVYVSQNPNVDGATYIEIVSGSLAGFIDGATLDMNFAENLYLGAAPSNLTVSRASTGYAETVEGTLTSFATNTARITNKGLLVEETRTNNITRSQELNLWSFFTNSTVGADADTAPDGTLTADRVFADAVSGVHLAQCPTFTSAATTQYAFSCYLKKGNIRYGYLQWTGGGAADSSLFLDFDTGLITFTSAAITGGTVQVLGNGWFRLSGLISTVGGGGAALRVGLSTSPTSQTFAGTTADYVTAWGAQIEAGASPTSYIPTTTGTVTRAADAVSLTGTNFSSWYTGGTSGTMYVEVLPDLNQTSTFPGYFAIDDGTANNFVQLLVNNSTNVASGEITSGGVSQVGFGATTLFADQVAKMAIAFATNDAAASFNGTPAVTDGSVTVPTGLTTARIGALRANVNTAMAYIRRVAYIPSRISNDALSLLTLAPPTLSMDFTTGTYVGATPANFTFSRASDGYAEDADGVWSVFASGVPRITSKGLLVEEARTNSIRNNSMQGAVAGIIGSGGTSPTNWFIAGTTQGVSTQIVDIGTENGIDYIDVRWFGTNSGAALFQPVQFELTTQIAATVGQVWSNSVFIKQVAGSTAGLSATAANLYVVERNAGGTFLVNPAVVASFNTTSFTRTTQTVTLSQATTAFAQPQITVNIAANATVDITLRIGWPQIELGAFATSPIRTTSGALTRSADNIRLEGAAFTSWFTAGPGVIYAEYSVNGASTASRPIEINDGSANNVHNFFGGGAGSNVVSGSTVAGGVTRFSTTAGGFNLTLGIRNKTAHAFIVGSYANIANGNIGLLTSGADANPLPTGMNQAQIGNRFAMDRGVSLYIQELRYYPVRLANNVLQSITT